VVIVGDQKAPLGGGRQTVEIVVGVRGGVGESAACGRVLGLGDSEHVVVGIVGGVDLHDLIERGVHIRIVDVGLPVQLVVIVGEANIISLSLNFPSEFSCFRIFRSFNGPNSLGTVQMNNVSSWYWCHGKGHADRGNSAGKRDADLTGVRV
ncbi:MAG: hypothetical protein HKM93_11220, partial [Desulfobacteraceae bacterium]|nr:hypothetical protein [Desulfobacteraceae bacterium]